MSKIAELVFEDLMARGKSIYTARQWRALVDKFVVCCGDKESYDRGDVIKFLAMLRGEGHRQNSILTMVRPLKLLCQIQGWDGGFPRLAMMKVKDSDINRPIFSGDEVRDMIRRGKKVLIPRELACLAFATTYGLRREELTDLVITDTTVTVDTVKGGMATTHLLANELREYIGGYSHCDIYYMTKLFKRIVKKLDVPLNSRSHGWHSIRRALATELLLLDVSALNILRFMRWSDASLKGEFGMLVIYAQRNQAEIDMNIFKAHPFLPVWAERV